MKIFDAIIMLEDKSIILVDAVGNKFQRLGNTQIMQIWNRKLLDKNDCSVASSIKNEEFLEKYLHTEFEIDEQWYQQEIEFPLLCKVKEQGWSDYKTVYFNSKSGFWFQTQFGESYTPTYNTKIIPLSDIEIKNLLRGY